MAKKLKTIKVKDGKVIQVIRKVADNEVTPDDIVKDLYIRMCDAREAEIQDISTKDMEEKMKDMLNGMASDKEEENAQDESTEDADETAKDEEEEESANDADEKAKDMYQKMEDMYQKMEDMCSRMTKDAEEKTNDSLDKKLKSLDSIEDEALKAEMKKLVKATDGRFDVNLISKALVATPSQEPTKAVDTMSEAEFYQKRQKGEI